MKKTLIILGSAALVALIAVFSVVGSYNGLVKKEELVKSANAKIEVALQRRYDLIPNVVDSTKGYLKHEKEIFTNIADARSKIGSSDRATKEEGQSELSSAISRLLVVKESYPELKANENFIRLQDQLEDTEDKIQASRRYYNGAVRQYNEFTVRFPANIFAGMFGYKAREFYNVSEEENAKIQEAPKVSF